MPPGLKTLKIAKAAVLIEMGRTCGGEADDDLNLIRLDAFSMEAGDVPAKPILSSSGNIPCLELHEFVWTSCTVAFAMPKDSQCNP